MALSEVDTLQVGDRKAVETLMRERNDELQFVGYVKNIDQKKKGKTEDSVLVLGRYRIYMLNNKAKVVSCQHMLEVAQLQSTDQFELHLIFKTFRLLIKSTKTDEIINTFRRCYYRAFPAIPDSFRFRLDVTPPSRLAAIPPPDGAVCGSFTETYRAVADFYAQPVREDIAWDIDNLFPVNRVVEFDLNEFESVLYGDFRALIGALHFNTYFQVLTLHNIKLEKDQPLTLAECFRSNATLTSLSLESNGLRGEAMVPLFEAFAANPRLVLRSLRIVDNAIDPPAAKALATALAKMPVGLESMVLKRTQIAAKSGAMIFAEMKKNPAMVKNLTELDLTDNRLGDEGGASLCTYLAGGSSVSALSVANCGVSLEPLFDALMRGTPTVCDINVCGNLFSKKKTELSTSFVRLLQTSSSLNHVNLSATHFPVELLKLALKAVTTNVSLTSFDLNLSENKLSVLGANLLSTIAPELLNLHVVDLTDAELGDEGIIYLCEGFTNNRSLRTLRIGKNFKVKTRQRQAAIEALVTLIDSECPIHTLKIEGAPKNTLGSDLFPLLTALGSNESITHLDVSGQAMGTKGAIIIGKALQTNCSLKTLLWDENGTLLQGFQSFKMAMQRNDSLCYAPVPVIDVAAALKADAANTDLLCKTIRELEYFLFRNLESQVPPEDFVAPAAAVADAAAVSLPTGVALQQLEALQKSSTTPLFGVQSRGGSGLKGRGKSVRMSVRPTGPADEALRRMQAELDAADRDAELGAKARSDTVIYTEDYDELDDS